MKKLWLLLGVAVILGLVVCAKPNGAIEVKSTPEGAAVYLDGDDTDEKTNTILTEIEPGDYTVKLVLEGHDDYSEDVTVEGGDTVLVEATLVANEFGVLQLNSTPEGAAIELDGAATEETTNFLFDSLAVGSHTLKLTLAEFKDWDSTITIVKDETLTVNAELTEKTGSIEVNSTPTGAAIWLDDVNTDQTTDYLFDAVPLGDHVVKLVLAGYRDWDTTVTVNEDETAAIDAPLEEVVEVELKYDEATSAGFGFKMKAGHRLAVEFTPGDFGSGMYPFNVDSACYVPMGWDDDPDNWDEDCYLVFFGPGEEPGTELGRKEAAGYEAMNFNWFDVSDLDITIESGSFYFGVENKLDDNPGLALDVGKPLYYVSWMYTVFIGEIDPKWAPFDNITIQGWPEETLLGDSCDMILRVKGMVPGGAEVVLTPTVRPHTSYSGSPLMLPADRKYEILDWRNIR